MVGIPGRDAHPARHVTLRERDRAHLGGGDEPAALALGRGREDCGRAERRQTHGDGAAGADPQYLPSTELLVQNHHALLEVPGLTAAAEVWFARSGGA